MYICTEPHQTLCTGSWAGGSSCPGNKGLVSRRWENYFWEAKTVDVKSSLGGQKAQRGVRVADESVGVEERGGGRPVRSTGVRSTRDLGLRSFHTSPVPLPWSFLFAPLTAYLGQGPG